jgi:hypothetical protein
MVLDTDLLNATHTRIGTTTMHKTIATYHELTNWLRLFTEGNIDILILEGNPGIGKTSALREALRDTPESEYLWLEGRLSAAKLYEHLYHARDQSIYLDDVDSLYQDKLSVNLLKSLCQTEITKTVQWEVVRRLPDGIPTRFTTTSKICLITNRWKSVNKHIEAVVDRGLLLSFEPRKEEIHTYAKRFVETSEQSERASQQPLCQKDVYEFIGRHQQFIPLERFTLRLYVVASKLYCSGLDWQQAVRECFTLDREYSLLLELLAEPSFSPRDRVSYWVSESGLSRRSYFRVLSELKAMQLV